MLSRRIIRIKVMQTLYIVDSMGHEMPPGEAYKILRDNINQARYLMTYLTAFLIEVAKRAETDALQRAHKNLPTFEDLHVNTRIAGNEIVGAILENDSFKKTVSEFKINLDIDQELVKKIYSVLLESAEYQEYINQTLREKKSEKGILDFIFKDLMLQNESFVSDAEEKFIHWEDDVDLTVILMNTLLQKPSAFNFSEMVGKEKIEYAKELLECFMEKKDYCLSLIKPKLKNWDPDRIAAIDMILLEMGVCEFLFFETIPPKVTINEYIDLAKEYSTEQSGHFVNGILDNIHKELVGQDKIHKRTFKNSTL
jgi:transcription antitermination protein NusB